MDKLGKSRGLNKANLKLRPKYLVASQNLIDFLMKKFPTTIPIAVLTGISKLYGKKVLKPDDLFLKQFQDAKKNIITSKFIQYINSDFYYDGSKPLNEEQITKIHNRCCNSDNELTFEFIMKRGEEVGNHFSSRMAKNVVKKFALNKRNLSVDDCIRVSQKKNRRNSRSPPHSKR